MEKECEIVQDLLFGYNDDILRNSSKELVEKHLKNCNECQEILKEIQKDTKVKAKNKEIDYLKKIRNKSKRKTIFISITTVLLFLIIVFNIFVFVNYKEEASKMVIILNKDITTEQRISIEENIKKQCKDAEIKYSSPEEELQKMKEKYSNYAESFNGYNEKNNPLRGAFYVKADEKYIEKIENSIIDMQGVSNIKTYINNNPYLLFIEKI